ncbi:hypothetical protein LI90_4320 [Carbonactinospora thermoautotrophica]|uniref:Uncharacterized protein n=1 Tax=Carbonactinospora thermoautotrophica TaxID=1469144 RepID=A0A132MZE0_9ACTN|nr:hypothetical protein LI90_4245 [Carbonactinospora thermoautotrophica]KWX03269.1 hypothetical protein LI90_4320 [Carbonactinospora thermoautotrophica]
MNSTTAYPGPGGFVFPRWRDYANHVQPVTGTAMISDGTGLLWI